MKFRLLGVFVAIACIAVFLPGCNQNHAEKHLDRAQILLDQKKPLNAIDEIDLAIAVDPSRYASYDRAFMILRQNRRWADAVRVGEAIIERGMSSKFSLKIPAFRIAEICLDVGDGYSFAGKISDAERVYILGLSIMPDSPALLNSLGYLYADKGMHYDKALELTRKAVSLEPQNALIIDSLGWAQYKTGDFHSAIRSLKEAVVLLPDMPELRYHLGAAYAKDGRRNEARIEFLKALILDPAMTNASADLVKLHKQQ